LPGTVAGPAPLGEGVATAERYMAGGEELEPHGAAPEYAAGLARLVGLVPASITDITLDPVPYWMDWEHELPGTWPPDPNDDLNSRSGPEWLERAGAISRERLRAAPRLPAAIGHADWESQNLRWRGRELYAVHDWDSIVRRPEAMIAGMSSLILAGTRDKPNQAASVEDSEAFLETYQAARGRRFTGEETALAWAAGLWIGAWKAKKALFYDDTTTASELEPQVGARIRRIGVQPAH
jgi:hypothetical protein